jgi:hypothetical protein
VRSSALIDNAVYQFGDFTPTADHPSGIDSDGLVVASIYDTTFSPGAQVVDGQTTYDLNDVNVMVADGKQIEITTVPGEFTNFLEVTEHVPAWSDVAIRLGVRRLGGQRPDDVGERGRAGGG